MTSRASIATRAACRAAEHILKTHPHPHTPSDAAQHLAHLNRAWRALNAAPPEERDPLRIRWRRTERALIDAHTQALELLRTLTPSTALHAAIRAALHAEHTGHHVRAEHHWNVAAREAGRLTPKPRTKTHSSWRRAELNGQPIRDPRSRRFRS